MPEERGCGYAPRLSALVEFPTADRYWIWLNNIVSTIWAEGPTRPVIAGMHSLTMFKGSAQIGEIGEPISQTKK